MNKCPRWEFYTEEGGGGGGGGGGEAVIFRGKIILGGNCLVRRAIQTRIVLQPPIMNDNKLNTLVE